MVIITLAILIYKMFLLDGQPTSSQDTGTYETQKKSQLTREELEKSIEENCRVLGLDSSRFLSKQ